MLESDRVTAEIICDGVHVHPAMLRVAVAAKGPDRIMAITDGTAGSGLPAGTRTFIGDRPITVGDVARLDDGTIAGSIVDDGQGVSQPRPRAADERPRRGPLLRDHVRPTPSAWPQVGRDLRGLDRGPDRS